MGTQILDPVTRIEGHLRVELDFASGTSGAVSDARCAAEMFRGYENILQGHNPTDAVQIVQRI
ncbi:MAG: hypothetical protein C4521_12220 [Actinobacteria bacterium]|nr:MAG: hypothetical protein C4521_12220 [Actinomycetota bacterium]